MRARSLVGAWLLFTFLLLGSGPLHAEDPTFGIELVYTNETLLQNFQARFRKHGNGRELQTPDKIDHNEVRRFAGAVYKACRPNCTLTRHHGKFPGLEEYRITFSSGWWFNISVDPQVIEIQTKPSTPAELAKELPLMQQYIFDVAKHEGFRVRTTGGDSRTRWQYAHVNIGADSAFRGDSAAFMRFFMDMANHPELASGILGQSFENAPPITHLSEAQQDGLAGVVSRFNAGTLGGIGLLARAIEREVYTATPTFTSSTDPAHYQAVGLKSIARTRFGVPRVELRFTRAPRTPEEYLLLTELLKRRIEIARAGKGRIVYARQPRRDYTDDERVNLFHIYVTESGLDWNKFAPLMLEHLRGRKLDRFATKSIRWHLSDERLLAERYAERLHISPGVYDRLLAMLGSVKDSALPHLEPLIAKMEEWAAKDVDYRDSASSLFSALAKTPAWKARKALLNGWRARIEGRRDHWLSALIYSVGKTCRRGWQTIGI